jgi:RNA polymerase sigma-70 factor (ECF subfamily)
VDNETEIIRRIKSGYTDDFRLLVQKYHRHLLNFIYRLISNKASVEDIGQEVFLAAFQSLKKFDETRGTPFSVWLFTIAKNRCIDEGRRKKRENISESLEPDLLADKSGNAEEKILSMERRTALERSLALLPAPFRSTMLDSLAGETIQESARKLGISQNTVKTRLFRARLKLKQIFMNFTKE